MKQLTVNCRWTEASLTEKRENTNKRVVKCKILCVNRKVKRNKRTRVEENSWQKEKDKIRSESSRNCGIKCIHYNVPLVHPLIDAAVPVDYDLIHWHQRQDNDRIASAIALSKRSAVSNRLTVLIRLKENSYWNWEKRFGIKR